MAVNGIEIEVGQVWETRARERTTITAKGVGNFPFQADNMQTYRTDGRWGDNSETGLDLVKLLKGVDARKSIIEVLSEPRSEALPLGPAEVREEPIPAPVAIEQMDLGAPPAERAVNPKDAIGSVKLPLHLWPAGATAMGSLGLLEGMLKYGRTNWRATEVIASIYVTAAIGHIWAWFEGEEVTTDTGNPHLANALASLAILVDAQMTNTLIDDRNFNGDANYRALIEKLTPQVKHLKELFKDRAPRHYTIADNEEQA
jgi:hypothetical protein